MRKPWLLPLSLFLSFSASGAHAQFQVYPGLDKPVGDHIPRPTDSLVLKGSRGETLTFLIQTDAPRCETLRLDIPFPLKLYRAIPFRTEKPSFRGAPVGEILDPLVPLESHQLCEPGWYLGEIAIPLDADPRRYLGELTLNEKEKRPIEVRVWKMKIPELPALPAYMEFSTWYALLGHYGKWHEGEEALGQKYLAAMRDHRIYPLKTWIKNPIPADIDLYRSLRTPSHLVGTYWDFPTLPVQESEETWKTYLGLLSSTLRASEFRDNALIYFADEPKKSEYKRLAKLEKISKFLVPNAKILVTAPYSPLLSKNTDIFVPNVNEFDTGAFAGTRVYEKAHKKLWWYVSCMSHGCTDDSNAGTPDFVIDRPSASIRTLAWLAQKYSVQGFLYYMVNYSYQFYPARDPWSDLYNFTGNGDGTLFYPGRPGMYGLREQTPVPSIRLKLWREASYDAEYLKWMKEVKAKPKWFKSKFSQLVRSPRSWDRNDSHYQVLRDQMGDYLDQN